MPDVVQLASKMAELGTRFCISQYELMFSEHSALANPTIKHLKEAIAICQDIGNKIERDEQKIYAENKNLEYLLIGVMLPLGILIDSKTLYLKWWGLRTLSRTRQQ